MIPLLVPLIAFSILRVSRPPRALYTTSEALAPIGGVCFSLPSPSRRGSARGELRLGGRQAKACPTSDEALTQQLSASCIVVDAHWGAKGRI
jgi:hypothetical protein